MSWHVEPIPSLEAAKAAWDPLADASGNPFLTWEWASSWWHTYHRGRRLFLHAVRAPDGRCAGIIPLYALFTRPLRVVRTLGHGAADQLGPVCHPRDRGVMVAALERLAVDHFGTGTLVLAERLPEGEDWPPVTAGRLLRRELSPRLALPEGDWESWLAGRSANLRQQVRRRERKLIQDHRLSFELVQDPEALPSAIDTLIALHRARWGSQSTAFDEAHEAFFRAFADVALRRGWLRLWLARLDGSPAAAWAGLRFGSHDWYYQSGRSPTADRLSVGFVLLTHTVRDAVRSGIRHYHLGVGAESYKERFADEHDHVGTFALGRGRLPAFASAGLWALQRGPRTLRARLA